MDFKFGITDSMIDNDSSSIHIDTGNRTGDWRMAGWRMADP